MAQRFVPSGCACWSVGRVRGWSVRTESSRSSKAMLSRRKNEHFSGLTLWGNSALSCNVGVCRLFKRPDALRPSSGSLSTSTRGACASPCAGTSSPPRAAPPPFPPLSRTLLQGRPAPPEMCVRAGALRCTRPRASVKTCTASRSSGAAPPVSILLANNIVPRLPAA